MRRGNPVSLLRPLSGRKALFARTTAVACSVSRGRYSLGTKLVVTEVSNEAFAFSASGVQNSMSNISMLRKLLIKSLFLANVNNIMAAPAVSFGFIISYAGKEVNRVEKKPCYLFQKHVDFYRERKSNERRANGDGLPSGRRLRGGLPRLGRWLMEGEGIVSSNSLYGISFLRNTRMGFFSSCIIHK